MGELGGSAWVMMAVAALWILIAAALSIVAARRIRDAGTIVSAARSLKTLLELSPARPLVVRPDGTIEADLQGSCARSVQASGRESSPIWPATTMDWSAKTSRRSKPWFANPLCRALPCNARSG
jgi:hypothetical protein